MRNSASYRKEAWELLTSNFWILFLVFLVFYATQFVAGALYEVEIEVLSLIVMLLLMPLGYGLHWVCLSFAREQPISVKDIVEPYLSGYQFLRVLASNVVVSILIFLWTLLFVIPGIIKGFSYSMVPYIMKDDDDISVLDAITLSRKIMDGNKWRLFKLYVTFIGWGIVILLTFGLAAFFVVPYVNVAMSCFYNDIKEKYEEDQAFYSAF